MKSQTCYYHPAVGWDEEPDVALDSDQTLIIVFGEPYHEVLDKALQSLVSAFPHACFIGCSTAGEIYGKSLKEGGMAVAIIRFAQTRIKLSIAAQSDISKSKTCGAEIATQLQAPDLQAVFLLSEGLHINGSLLLEGVLEVLPSSVVVTGGLAADFDRFEQTWVLDDGKPVIDKVACVGFYGDAICIQHGSRGGWDVMGPEREVTRSDGNMLFELDGKPALELYKQYLGDRASGLPATGLLFPLAIQNKSEPEELTVRTILAVDEQENSITFAGNIPQGSIVQMMYANFDRLVDGAVDATEDMNQQLACTGDKLCIAISCVGRRLILGQRTEEEIEAVCEHLQQDTKMIGYYSYGEISPLASGRCDLHNQTMTLTLISENLT